MGRPRKNHEGIKTQAQRIIDRFGGAKKLSIALAQINRPRNPATLYKWTYPRSQPGKGGTGGLIPTDAWDDILEAAKHLGITLNTEDFDPRPSN